MIKWFKSHFYKNLTTSELQGYSEACMPKNGRPPCKHKTHKAWPPCGWANSNICVAEGCFGESCLKENLNG